MLLRFVEEAKTEFISQSIQRSSNLEKGKAKISKTVTKVKTSQTVAKSSN